MCNSRKVGGDKIHLWLNYLWRGLKCSLESMKQPFAAGEAVVCRLLSESYSYLRAERQRSSIAGVSWLLLPWHRTGWEPEKCGGQSVLCGLHLPPLSWEQMGFRKTAVRRGTGSIPGTWPRWQQGAAASALEAQAQPPPAVFCSSWQEDYGTEVLACRPPYRELNFSVALIV